MNSTLALRSLASQTEVMGLAVVAAPALFSFEVRERPTLSRRLFYCAWGSSRIAKVEEIKMKKFSVKWLVLISFIVFAASNGARAFPTDNQTDVQKTVAALDTQYQAAVKNNDAATMARILADDFIIVTGSGKTYTKADLLNEARTGRYQYERQDDTEQTVRVWGDVAVVTAKLFAKGTENGKPFEYTVWFSDTYLRTPSGWRYTFAQSSLPLPKTSTNK
jgi:ketosteroid isomerase-like protein